MGILLDKWTAEAVAGLMAVHLAAIAWLSSSQGAGRLFVLASLACVILFSAWAVHSRGRACRRAGTKGQAPDMLPWVLSFLPLWLWIFAQAMNPTHDGGDGAIFALRPLDHIRWLPGSVSATRSLESLGLLSLSGGVFWVTRCLVARSGAAMRVALSALVGGFSVVAVVCIVQRLETRPFPVFERTGTFVNENQCAACLNLALAPAFWLAMDFRRRAQASGRLSHPGPLFFLFGGLLLAGTMLSGSRAGILIAGATLLTLGFLIWRSRKGQDAGIGRESDFPMMRYVVIALAAAIGPSWPTLRKEFSSLRNLPVELGFRADLYQGTWTMFRSNWVAGTGAGTFSAAFPYYKPEDLTGHFRHAHCEPLQMLGENGLAGSLLVVTTLVFALRGSRNQASDPQRPENGGARLDSVARLSLAGVGLHSLIDFPFREPAILLTSCMLLGLCSVPSVRDRRWTVREKTS